MLALSSPAGRHGPVRWRHTDHASALEDRARRAFLLVGPDDEVTARQLVRDITAGGSPPLQVVVDAHVDSGYYVFADPTRHAGYVRGLMLGRRGPDLRSRKGFDTDGVDSRMTHTFGFSANDWRAVVYTPAV